MLTLASLLVTAILAPASASELRNPMGPETTPRPAATAVAPATCPVACKDGELRQPFRGIADAKPVRVREAEPGLRDPFDAPRRATTIQRDPVPARRVPTSGPRPATPPSELRSPFGRA